jgi:hypothetical protein
MDISSLSVSLSRYHYAIPFSLHVIPPPSLLHPARAMFLSLILLLCSATLHSILHAWQSIDDNEQRNTTVTPFPSSLLAIAYTVHATLSSIFFLFAKLNLSQSLSQSYLAFIARHLMHHIESHHLRIIHYCCPLLSLGRSDGCFFSTSPSYYISI